jgi:hypothetical protein
LTHNVLPSHVADARFPKVSGSLMRLPLKTIDQKKRAVITRPFGREASIVMENPVKTKYLAPMPPS